MAARPPLDTASDFTVCSVWTSRPEPRFLSVIEHIARAGVDVRVWLLDPKTHVPASVQVMGTGPGAKFDLVRRMAPPADLDTDVVVVDDDVTFTRGSLGAFVAIARLAGLDLAAPAHTFRSYSSHAFAIARPASMARRTSFVEIGPVTFFGGRARPSLLAADTAGGMGYGTELNWWRMERESMLRFGIVDATRIRHLRKVGTTYDVRAHWSHTDRLLEDAGLTSWSDIQQTYETWRPQEPRPPWLGS